MDKAFLAQSFIRSQQKTDYYFYYDQYPIYFSRVRSRSKRGAVKVRVHPTLEVEVLAPPTMSDEDVVQVARGRGRWIFKQLKAFYQNRYYVVPLQYKSGETHHYLGRQYQLKVYKNEDGGNCVRLMHGYLEVYTNDVRREIIQSLLHQWYLDKARDYFNKRLVILLPRASWVIERPSLRLQTMKTQWGSCSKQGRITLNPYLVKASQEAIDYVILHELCHIAEYNHSNRFYELMDRVMPQWRVIKERLDNNAYKILNGV
ncbi:M48 family metallopeptidase [Ignatzschineria cameli]|uniref:M48 family metallopeptidase n=1 Tax=Ignatzschineria cameli TaxID=2182793 RepID=UPI000D6127DD|nr:SprT family zinc-dependent metalloprotease [Ignatzschineria cameli]PWD85236.1 metal-dependent hydrolase [Ignatzschineria cameli]